MSLSRPPLHQVLAQYCAGKGKAWLCPFHDDRNPSLSQFVGDDGIERWKCHGCGASGDVFDFIAKTRHRTLADVLAEHRIPGDGPPPPLHQREPTEFGAIEAGRTWDLAFQRARSDEHVEQDRQVYDFLRRRGLSEAWESASFGVLAHGLDQSDGIRRWVERGYRLILPLFDLEGNIRNIQSRNVLGRSPKTRFPFGSRASGLVFTNDAGLDLLGGAAVHGELVVFGEGLTDHLALTISCPWPVISTPGTSMAVSSIGPWVRGLTIVVGLDSDEAGEKIVASVAQAAFDHGAERVLRLEWMDRSQDVSDVMQSIGATGLRDWIEAHVQEVAHVA